MKTILSLLLAFAAVLSASTQPDTAPKNVVFILVDDLGWKDLACYGSEFYETPNLDAFSGESMRFLQAYSASPVCSPTRAAIMTGQHPARVTITDWIPGQQPKNSLLIMPEDRDELALPAYTMAEAFQDRGYATFFAGKWHLGDEGYFPENQGFEHNKGGMHKGSPPGGYYSPYNNHKLPDGPEGEYLPDRLTDESIRFIEARDERPFFLFLSYYTVHTPIQASNRHIEHYEQKRSALPDSGKVIREAEHTGMTTTNQVQADYASMVTAMDENVGRLFEALKEEGLWEETLIVFTSDNGGLSTLPARRTGPTSVRPLRAGKGWCYEGGIRIPLMIRVPGLADQGKQSSMPVISQDLFPTLASLTQLQLPDTLTFDGVNLAPLFHDKRLNRNSLYWHYPHYHGSTWTPGAAIRQGKWKLVHFYETEQSELYDLSTDPGEQNDLADIHPERVVKLKALLKQRQAETGAQIPTSRK